eukprot:gene19804-biopygen19480
MSRAWIGGSLSTAFPSHWPSRSAAPANRLRSDPPARSLPAAILSRPSTRTALTAATPRLAGFADRKFWASGGRSCDARALPPLRGCAFAARRTLPGDRSRLWPASAPETAASGDAQSFLKVEAAPSGEVGEQNEQKISVDKQVRTALSVEPRDGRLCVFMPPLERLEDYLELVAAVEATAEELNLPL